MPMTRSAVPRRRSSPTCWTSSRPAAGREAATTRGWHVGSRELIHRAAVGTLFGIHTMRFRIYLAPGSGLRVP
jgi:hypothetical protein